MIVGSSASVPDRPDEVPAALCSHCGLGVPASAIVVERPEQFCCAGCRGAYALIRAAGLGHYYELRAEEASAEASAAAPTDSDYSDYDTPAFIDRFSDCPEPGVRRVQLYVQGVHCAACLWLLEKLPSLISGVVEARLQFERRVLEVSYRPEQIALSRVARKLDSLGYPPRPYSDRRAADAQRMEERRLLTRLGVAGAIAGNVMLLSFALYSGAFADMSADELRLFEVLSLLVSLPALSYGAWEFYRGALSSLRTRTPHMDLPVSLGILAGAVWGTYKVLLGHGEPYFDTVTALIFLLLVGRYLELVQQNRSRRAIERAELLTPGHAWVLQPSGELRKVLVEQVLAGDLVLVKSGETVPVDGQVASGEAEVDNRVLTGESRPVAVGPGAKVCAGATNLRGVLRIVSDGGETRVRRLLAQVERERRRRVPTLRLADSLAGHFVVVVLVLALVTLLLWLPSGLGQALDHSIALLIVACPCALGLATPLTFSAALARAAEERVLIKGGDVLEVVRKPCLFVFDKTGTLTTGRLSLMHWQGDEAVKPLVRALEANSAHPIAQALERALPAACAPTLQHVREVQGGGMRAEVDGDELLVGAPVWVAQTVKLTPWAETAIVRHTRRGHTPVAVALGGKLVALAFLDDPPARGVVECLLKLKRQGSRLVVLSGDHPVVTNTTARRLAQSAKVVDLFDEAIGGASPERKLAYVLDKKQSGELPVVVVGDGVNDAAALAAANVGIAVKGGAEASLLAADVYFADLGLGQLPELVAGASRTLATVRRGILLSLAYNVVGVSLAMAGLVGPLLAAVLMPLSSLSVVTNAYRSKSFGGAK